MPTVKGLQIPLWVYIQAYLEGLVGISSNAGRRKFFPSMMHRNTDMRNSVKCHSTLVHRILAVLSTERCVTQSDNLYVRQSSSLVSRPLIKMKALYILFAHNY